MEPRNSLREREATRLYHLRQKIHPETSSDKALIDHTQSSTILNVQCNITSKTGRIKKQKQKKKRLTCDIFCDNFTTKDKLTSHRYLFKLFNSSN